jgi:hypothetical protein
MMTPTRSGSPPTGHIARAKAADNEAVDSASGNVGFVRLGSVATLVTFALGRPKAYIVTLARLDPLEIILQEDPKLQEGEACLVVSQRESKIYHVDADVRTCNKYGDHWKVSADSYGWQKQERRKYPRIATDIPGALEMLHDSNDSVTAVRLVGRFADLSLGGGRFECSEPAPAGSLVHWSCKLPGGDTARGLGVVARVLKDGAMGLEFVDFIGASRIMLEAFFLDKAA